MKAATLESAAQVALLLDMGQRVVLQRVRNTMTPTAFAQAVAKHRRRPCVVVTDPLNPAQTGARIVEGRNLPASILVDWQEHRASLGDGTSPLVVLLDVASERLLLMCAPHLASWAGGVRRPAEPIPSASTRALTQRGQRSLRNALRGDGSFARRNLGLLVCVEIASERLFEARSGESAYEVALNELDDGLLYLHVLREEDLG